MQNASISFIYFSWIGFVLFFATIKSEDHFLQKLNLMIVIDDS